MTCTTASHVSERVPELTRSVDIGSTATRNIIGEPFFDGLIAQSAFWAGKALCAYGAGEDGPLLWFASAGARVWLCLCQLLHQLIRSRMLFVRFNLAGLFTEAARCVGVVLTYPPAL